MASAMILCIRKPALLPKPRFQAAKNPKSMRRAGMDQYGKHGEDQQRHPGPRRLTRARQGCVVQCGSPTIIRGLTSIDPYLADGIVADHFAASSMLLQSST
jgi:hypothetical protein